MITKLGWTLAAIDETDITSLFDCIDRINEMESGEAPKVKRVFADQADFL